MSEVKFAFEEGIALAPIVRDIPPAYLAYPLEDMPEGSSFFVPADDKAPLTVASHVRNFKQDKAIELGCTIEEIGMKFKTRKVTENDVKGIRVWKLRLA
jgi:hypothetical protein